MLYRIQTLMLSVLEISYILLLTPRYHNQTARVNIIALKKVVRMLPSANTNNKNVLFKSSCIIIRDGAGPRTGRIRKIRIHPIPNY